jgi:hypothetical protein
VIVPGGKTAIRAEDVLLVLANIGQARTIERLVHPDATAADGSAGCSPDPAGPRGDLEPAS